MIVGYYFGWKNASIDKPTLPTNLK
jgi:hypothetical protein